MIRKWWRRVTSPVFKPQLVGNLETLWYEDQDGHRLWYNPPADELGHIPSNAKYQVSRFPRLLATNYLRLNDDGSSTYMGSGISGFSSDLVIAMVKSGMKFDDAVILSANSCERCMNVLAYQYGLDWGYPYLSEDWYKAGTACVFCRGVAP